MKDDSTIIEQLDRLDRMNTDAAKGLREMQKIDRNVYHAGAEDADEPFLVLTALFPSDEGMILITDRFESEDYAWSGYIEVLEILDELVEEGHPDPQRCDVVPFDA